MGKCAQCGADLCRPGQRVFCSKRCYYDSRSVSLTCPCGTEFRRTKGRMRTTEVAYCTRECYDRFRVTKPSNYKGEDASYSSMHKWIVAHRGKATKCEDCGKATGRIHWANLSGHYRRELSDWKQLCPSCHKKFDQSPGRPAGIRERFADASHTPDAASDVPVTCRGCGEVFLTKPAQAKTRKFCSAPCFQAACSKGYRKKNNRMADAA